MSVRLAMAAVVLLVGGVVSADDPKDDKGRLQGEWVVTSVERGGQPVEGRQDRKLVIRGDEWTAPGGGKFRFKLEAAKDPKRLDLTSGQSGEEQSWPGIYKIDGDTLTFCRSLGPGGERPAEFKGGPDVFLIVCKRAEKK